MKVYIDILLLKNIIINFFIFKMMDMLLNKKTKCIRVTIVSIIVSILSIIVLLMNSKYYVVVICKLFFTVYITFALYKPKKCADIFKYCILLYTVTFFLGGVMSSLINEINNINVSIFVSMVMCFILIALVKTMLQNKYRKIKNECTVKIIINEKIIAANVLIDTGNFLQDIITGDTVIVLNKEKIEEFSETLHIVLNNAMFKVPENFKTKIRIIEYSSLGNESDFLRGVKADRVTVYFDDMVLDNKNVIVAMSSTKIKKYDGLASIDLIEGGNVIGNSSIIKIKS